jgi:hypothetical protein
MLKQVWIAECDLCGKVEPAQRKNGRYNEIDYVLPIDWSQGVNKNFCICPECLSRRRPNND